MKNFKLLITAGMVAGMVMGMIQMVYEAVAGQGFWSPVILIAAAVLRDLQHTSMPAPAMLVPIILGLMGHMTNSIILSGIFYLMLRRTQGRLALTVSGLVFGIVVFGLMWLVVLPMVDPVMKELNGAVFAIAHLMWGATLGRVLSSKTTAHTDRA